MNKKFSKIAWSSRTFAGLLSEQGAVCSRHRGGGRNWGPVRMGAGEAVSRRSPSPVLVPLLILLIPAALRQSHSRQNSCLKHDRIRPLGSASSIKAASLRASSEGGQIQVYKTGNVHVQIDCTTLDRLLVFQHYNKQTKKYITIHLYNSSNWDIEHCDNIYFLKNKPQIVHYTKYFKIIFQNKLFMNTSCTIY